METPITVSIATPSATPSNSEVSLAVLAETPLKEDLVQLSPGEPLSGTTALTSPPISPIPNATNDSHLSSPQPTLTLPKSQADTSDVASNGGEGVHVGQNDDAAVPGDQQISALSSPSLGTQALGDNSVPNAGHGPESNSDATVPTLEHMGLQNLSPMELGMLLQQAYEMIQEKNREIQEKDREIQDKDRDINMAAMMGQNLVQNNDLLTENNTILQNKYQHLLTQLRHQRMHRPRHLTPPRKIQLGPSDHHRGVVGGEDGAADGDENWEDFEPSQSSLRPPTSSSSYSSFRRSTGQSGVHQNRSYKDIEKLATLEEQNAQLQVKIDAITKELKQGRRQAYKRHRKAEKELKAVREELDQSAHKVSDLEAQNGRLIEASRQIRQRRIMLKSQLPAPGSIPGSTMAAIAMEMQGDEVTIQEMLAEDNRIFEELRDRLHSLERKNTNLQHQKTEADKRSQQLAQDLSNAQKDREELMATVCQLTELQNAYNEQTEHVRELENTVEELQNTIGTMSARFSQMNSPLMSPVQSVWRRDDEDFKMIKSILQGPSSPSTTVPKSPSLLGSPRSPRMNGTPRSPRLNGTPRSPALNGVPRSPGMKGVPRSPGMRATPRSPAMRAQPPQQQQPQRQPRMTLLAELENEFMRNFSFFGPPRVVEQQQQQEQQEPIHIPGLRSPKSPMHLPGLRAPKSPKVLKDHHHDSESETFSDDAGGRVKGWRKSIRNMDEESVCESSNCVRKRRHRFRYDGSDDDIARSESHIDEDSDVERYQLLPRGRDPQMCDSMCGDETDGMSDCSHYRPSSPGCCCHLYYDEEDSDYYDEDEVESVAGWAHFIDAEASIYGYDMKRDGHYVGRRQRRGFFDLVHGVIMLFRFFWRWCRFICILSTALGIALYRGPDALLTDGQ